VSEILNDVDPLLLISRWLHIAAAVAALGGALFVRYALSFAVKQTLDDAAHERLREALRRRWAPVVHISIVVLLLTGSLNFYWLALAPKIPPMPYHAIFGVKLLAAFFIFFVAAGLHGRSPAFENMRKARKQWLTALLVVGAILVALSGLLSQLRAGHATGG